MTKKELSEKSGLQERMIGNFVRRSLVENVDYCYKRGGFKNVRRMYFTDSGVQKIMSCSTKARKKAKTMRD